MKPLKWVEVDLGAIGANARLVRARLSRGTRLMAVIKADAYGHGAVEVAKALAGGADRLGVLTVAEAERLRKAGIRAPLQLLAPILPESASEVARLKLSATIDDLSQARALNAAAPAAGLPVHLDLDFGLGRWGLPPRALPQFLAGLKRLKRLRLAGLSAHIDYLPGKNAVEAEEKLGAFSRIAAGLRRAYPGLICHAANSSVLQDFPHWQLDMARVGNLLYGINPSKARPWPLKVPWRFCARIMALRRVVKGQAIGYASEYIAPRGMKVATLPVGYADGLTLVPAERRIGFGGGHEFWGWLGKAKAPLIGRCAISHVLLDVSAAASARLGDTVALPIRRTAASLLLPRIYRG